MEIIIDYKFVRGHFRNYISWFNSGLTALNTIRSFWCQDRCPVRESQTLNLLLSLHFEHKLYRNSTEIKQQFHCVFLALLSIAMPSYNLTVHENKISVVLNPLNPTDLQIDTSLNTKQKQVILYLRYKKS